MKQLATAAREFFNLLLRFLPRAFLKAGGAWLVTFALLALGFRRLKHHLKPSLVQLDDGVRAWAKTLRYRAEHPQASLATARAAGELEVAASGATIGDIDSNESERDEKAAVDEVRREIEATPHIDVAQLEALQDEDGVERVPLTWFFRFWTNFASAPSLSFFSLAVPLWMYHRAKLGGASEEDAWTMALPWLLPGICYSGSMLMSFVLKRVFKRLRPQRKAGDFGHKLKDGSFPSGHSLTSFCFWIAVAATSGWIGLAAPTVISLSLLAITIVSLTGLSRVYMGVHFPSDVLGGYTIGVAWCAACFWTFRAD